MVSVLVCRHSVDVRTLHAGAGLAGVAAEIILKPEGVPYCLRLLLSSFRMTKERPGISVIIKPYHYVSAKRPGFNVLTRYLL